MYKKIVVFSSILLLYACNKTEITNNTVPHEVIKSNLQNKDLPENNIKEKFSKDNDVAYNGKIFNKASLPNGDIVYSKLVDENAITNTNMNGVALKANYNIYLVKTDKDGNNKAEVKLETNSEKHKGLSSVAIDKLGNIVVIWYEQESDLTKNILRNNLYMQYYDFNLKQLSKILEVSKNTNTLLYYNIMIDDNNNSHILWNPSDGKYYSKIFDNKGNVLKEETILKDFKSTPSYEEKVAIYNNKYLRIVANNLQPSFGIIGYLYNLDGLLEKTFDISKESTLNTSLSLETLNNNKGFLISYYITDPYEEFKYEKDGTNKLGLQIFDSNFNRIGDQTFSKQLKTFNGSPRTLVNKDNSFTLFWKEIRKNITSTTENNFYYILVDQKFDSTGKKIGSETTLLEANWIDFSVERNTDNTINLIYTRSIDEKKYYIKKLNDNLDEVI